METLRSKFEERDEDKSNVRDFQRKNANTLAEPSDFGPKEYRLDENEIREFVAAYRACGNIEKALGSLGKGSRYKKHASEIIQVYGLRKNA